MPKTTFAQRLAYLRWQWAAGTIKATDAAFATWLGVDGGWYSKWKQKDGSPARDQYKAIRDRVGVTTADWLFDEDGTAPEPELWARWSQRVAEPAVAYRGTAPKQERPAAGKKKPRGRKAS